MSQTMTVDEWKQFIRTGTRTGKLGVVRRDGRPLVVPIWFILDDDDVIRFQTSTASAKVRALLHEPRVCLTVDEEIAPYSFVAIEATASLAPEDPDELWRVAHACAERYMGADLADAFARRNAVDGECTVELRPTRVIAHRNVSA